LGGEEEPVRTGLRAGWIRRRWWIPVLTVIVATAIGGFVADSRPGSYNATMVFVVQSKASKISPISPDGAQRLASTYAALLLNDDLIAQAIGGQVRREPGDVKGRLAAVNPVNTALIRVSYAGRSRVEALTGMRALEGAITGSRPASPVVLAGSVRTVQAAQVTAPSSPMSSLLLAALLGLCAAIVIVIALERSDMRVDDTAILEEHIPDIPVLGTVAPVGRHGGLPVREQPMSLAAEGFQGIRIALERIGLGSDIEVIVVMSADKQEGRTTFAANLGMAVARQERMVLLVSGDMRGQGLEKLLKVTPSVGLADLLDEAAHEGDDPPLRALFSIAPDLWLLPAGSPSGNPAELLKATKIREVLRRVGYGDPLAIVDTPPALQSADAAALASVADGAVLVIRSGRSRLRSVQETTVGLRRDNIRVLGMVLVDHRTRRRRQAYVHAGGSPKTADQPQILPLDSRARSRGDPRDEGPKAAGSSP
jgi:Mrp family chromosome partitioning ATPase/capsular polysaccharide biosynthesis protein